MWLKSNHEPQRGSEWLPHRPALFSNGSEGSRPKSQKKGWGLMDCTNTRHCKAQSADDIVTAHACMQKQARYTRSTLQQAGRLSPDVIAPGPSNISSSYHPQTVNCNHYTGKDGAEGLGMTNIPCSVGRALCPSAEMKCLTCTKAQWCSRADFP